MSVRIEWKGDRQLRQNMGKYARQVQQTKVRIAQYWGPQIEADAKRNAPWQDRTANARQSLYYVVEEDGNTVVLWLSHGVEYGKWLELRHQGQYAIILPTLETYYERVMGMVREVFR